MKLSIITVCYNNLEGLKRTYRSVVEQTARKDFEWIIIDGASTDGTPQWLQEHDAEIDIWVSEPDTGIYNAMNKGVRLAKGEYLLFLNSGDCLNGKNIVAECIPNFDGKTDFIYGDELQFNPAENKFAAPWISPSILSPSDFIRQTLPHQASFIKRSRDSFYREDIGYLADWAFFMEQVIRYDATMKKIPLTISIFYLDGISFKKFNSLIEDRRKVFCQLFSESLYEDLKRHDELRNLPFLSLNKQILRIRHALGKIKRLIYK